MPHFFNKWYDEYLFIHTNAALRSGEVTRTMMNVWGANMRQQIKAIGARTAFSSVANAMRLIRVFTDDAYEMSISELAKRLRLPKSTVHRLASTLVETGVLIQNDENERYHLGLMVFEMGALVQRNMDFLNEARQCMVELRDKTGETTELAILDHGSVLYVNSVESRQAIRVIANNGLRKPAYATAAGNAMLAYQEPGNVSRIFLGNGADTNADTIYDQSMLEQRLKIIRSLGYAIAGEGNDDSVLTLAAPIRDDSGEVIAALSLSGPSHRLTRKVLATCVPDVLASALSISIRLGYQPGLIRAARWTQSD
jgi:IclR family KDG regulon transcriptional repressor